MDFIEKFKSILPAEIDFDDLYCLAPADLWKSDPRKAGVLALERADIFDRSYYLTKADKIYSSPIIHFINNINNFNNQKAKQYFVLKNKKNLLNNVIITMTTHPERLKTIRPCLESIVNQTMKPSKIVIYVYHLDYDLCIKNCDTDLLKLIDDNKIIINKYKKNLMSYLKLVPALKDFNNNILITVDDDIIYKDNLIECLYNSYLTDKNSVHCNRCHRILFSDNKICKYNKWLLEYKVPSASYLNFITGVGGVLYPPNIFYKDVLNEKKFMKICKYTDDIWFWAMTVLNHHKIRLIKNYNTKLVTIPYTQEKGMYNTINSKGNNDKNMHKIIQLYPQLSKMLVI